jgi:ADP-ribose pyrophosphatase
MGIINNLLSDYKLHKKSRTKKHASYPARFVVPDDKVSWQIKFPEYLPVEFSAPIVLDVKTPWADPEDISKINHPLMSYEGNLKLNEKGVPLNPFGRTGIAGRGVLGKWGANFAVDGLITTIHPQSDTFRVLTITRSDTGETAFPGGMVDPGENVIDTRNRELEEEISLNKDDLANPLYEKIAGRGYVDDPRNTDNAWIETTVIHTHLSYDKAKQMNLSAGDDAKDFKWLEVTKESISNFYASHGLTLLLAIKELVNQRSLPIEEAARAFFRKTFEE